MINQYKHFKTWCLHVSYNPDIEIIQLKTFCYIDTSFVDSTEMLVVVMMNIEFKSKKS